MYLNVKYVIATRNYDFIYYWHWSVIKELLRYSTETTVRVGKNIKL